MTAEMTMRAVPGIPDIEPGDDLRGLLLAALQSAGLTLADGDILVVAQKVVSKAEGRYVRLVDIEPGAEAIGLASELNKDARKVEVILRESDRVVRAARHNGRSEGLLITQHRLGFVCANAAIDESNIGRPGSVLLLPEDPDASARELRDGIKAATGAEVGVVITDTFGRPWRLGLVNVAIGLAGVPAVVDLTGGEDAFGRTLSATMPAFADEIAAASGLLMGKDSKQPVMLFRGLSWVESTSSARDILRPEEEDLFT